MLLCVDDLHWCDEESLHWLVYLARRIEALAVGMVVTRRSAEPGVANELVDALAAEPAVERLTPGALSPSAGAVVLGRSLRTAPDEVFGAACHQATGGNPLLLVELARALAVDGIDPVAENASGVARIAPASVAHAVVSRLAKLPPEAINLARAVAVLGEGAPLVPAATLAGLEDERAGRFVAMLTDAAILVAGAELDFVHPLVRAALYEDLNPSVRAEMHARAATILGVYAGAEDAAQHILLAPRGSSPGHVELLRRAAALAVSRGAPESAVRFLQRALEEPMGEDRAEVLGELGRLEVQLADPSSGIDHLRGAIAEAATSLVRGRVAHLLADVLTFSGRFPEVVEVLDESLINEVQQVDEELAVRLRAALVPARFYLTGARPSSEDVRRAGYGLTLGEREMLSTHALAAATAPEAIKLAETAIGHGKVLPGQLDALGPLFFAINTLIYCDRFAVADRALDQAMTDARDRGAVFDLGRYGFLRALSLERRGQIPAAEAEIRAAVETVGEAGMAVLGASLAASLALLLDCLRKRGSWQAGLAALEQWPVPQAEMGLANLLLTVSRARFDLACGNTEPALQALLMLEPLAASQPLLDVRFLEIRTTLAPVLAARGERTRAAQMARQNVEAARAWGLQRPIGTAQAAAGLATGGDRGIELLRDAHATLAGIEAQYEQAVVLVELGSALRRGNQRVRARDPLRSGQELAARCGATELVKRAEDELRAAGARPRRTELSGVNSLTPSEFRVARLAATGMGNREIAQALFVTRKTVEAHLGNVYTKLGITSRAELPRAFDT